MKKILIVDDIEGWIRFHKNNIEYLKLDDLKIDCTNSAHDASNLIINNILTPYDVIITDLQMESDYLPQYAGEWLIEYIKTFKEYNNSKIVIISGSPKIEQIAKKHEVFCIPKSIVRHYDSSIYKQYVNMPISDLLALYGYHQQKL